MSGLHQRIVLFFSALALVHTWPLALHAGTRVLDLDDSILNVWLLTATARQLVAQPWAPFELNMFYPFPHALATLDHQFAGALLAAPVALLGGPLLAANLLTIATFVVAGVFTALLVVRLTDSPVAGLVAGSVFAFSGMRLENLNHSHVLGSCWWPLALLAWHCYAAQPTRRHLGLASAAVLWLLLGSRFSATVGGLALAIVAAGEWLRSAPNRWLLLRRAAAPAVGLVVVPALFALPYLAVDRVYAPQRPRAFHVSGPGGPSTIDRTVDAPTFRDLSAPVEGYLGLAAGTHAPWAAPLRTISDVPGARVFPGTIAAIFAALAALAVIRWQVRVFPAAWIAVVGTALFALAVAAAAFDLPGGPISVARSIPAFFVLLVAAFAIWLAAPAPDPGAPNRWIFFARLYLVLAVIGMVLSLGPDVRAFGVSLGRGAYPASLPPFSLLRASARFGALFSLGAAVLAGCGYAIVARRVARPWLRHGLGVAVLALVNAELVAAPLKLTHVGWPPDAYEWLKQAAPGPIVEFPIHANAMALYWSLDHRRPLVNGLGAVRPGPFYRLEERDDLSPDMLAHLRTFFHPRYVLVNTSAYQGERAAELAANIAASAEELKLVAQFGARQIFEIAGPSRGRIVTRSYPAGTVANRRSILVKARVEQMPERGTPRLQVWGNGRLLGASGFVGAGETARLTLPLPPDAAGGLDLEVMADYRPDGGHRPRIGSRGPASAADIQLTVAPERTRIEVNGHVWIGEKGYTVVTFEPDGQVREVRAFNTSWSEEASHALAVHLRSLAPGTIVAVATFFDASRALTDDAVRELAAVGLAGDLRGRFRWAHAGIGVKGAPPGAAIESIGETHAECRIGSPTLLTVAVDEIRID